MPRLTLTTVVQCVVNETREAHELAKELETQLHTAIENILPRLPHARFIRDGSVKFSMEIEGRRLRIQVNENEGPDLEDGK
jgi:hypothetical protein